MSKKPYINAETGTTRSKEQIKSGLFPSNSLSFSWLLIYDPLLESWIKPLEKAIIEITKDTSNLICAELAGDFHLGYARQLTDKSSLLFDLAF